jgi:hypothetical protein
MDRSRARRHKAIGAAIDANIRNYQSEVPLMRIEPVNAAATYGVACELARRNIRPHVKQIAKSELHYETAAGETVYLHVAGKQDGQWPLIELPDSSDSSLYRQGGIHCLVLVDFEGKAPGDPSGRGAAAHPDFYLLGREEWNVFIAALDEWKWVSEGRAYYTFEPRHVATYRERWDLLPQ